MGCTTLDELKALFPCRSNEIETLYGLYGHLEEPLPDCVYVSGAPSTGKSSIVKTVLERLGVKVAAIDLIRCYTPRILFESILSKFDTPTRCDNIASFLDAIKNVVQDFDGTVLVLDGAEKMRSLDCNLLPAFMRLRELCNARISVIFIGETWLEKCFPKFGLLEPITLHFSQYTRDEIVEILSRDYRAGVLPDYGPDFYRNYVNLMLSVCYRTCRDLSELRYVVRCNFERYCGPVAGGKVAVDDWMGLWRKISPDIKKSLDTLYLRIRDDDDRDPLDAAKALELPYYAKYLLIAAYLASHNPAKYDKRLFVKEGGKKRKTLGDVKRTSKVSEQLATLLGPKPFSLDRLFAIFYAIIDEKVGFNNNLLVQVSSLVELQLLLCLSDNSTCLDASKYKCNVNYDFMQTVSKMVGFNIRKYLADFAHL